MNMKNIVILGSTGSIGTQTIEVLHNLGDYSVYGISAYENVDKMYEQILALKPKVAVMLNPQKCEMLKEKVKGLNVSVLSGMDSILEMVSAKEVDLVVNSLVGSAGLLPTLEAINNGKQVALANKETLVCGGHLVMPLAKEKGIEIMPIDSEHSAILQCLSQKSDNKYKTIYLTASGGPFRGFTKDRLTKVTLQDALKHPNWSMGTKITIDSASLMNKGLEVIEAKWLFDASLSDIQVVVHPQSIVHSMVEFDDNSIIAQLGEADMRIPIQYALTYPKRVSNDFKRYNIFEKSNLTFEKPDMDAFPCLKLAYYASEKGGLYPAVLNAANEGAVSLFSKELISFLDISLLIENALNEYNTINDGDVSLKRLLEVDKWARDFVENSIKGK